MFEQFPWRVAVRSRPRAALRSRYVFDRRTETRVRVLAREHRDELVPQRLVSVHKARITPGASWPQARAAGNRKLGRMTDGFVRKFAICCVSGIRWAVYPASGGGP